MVDPICLLAGLVAGLGLGPSLRAVDLAAGHVVGRLERRRLQRLVRGSVVLTYDDGPGRDLQPRLLRTLADAGTAATFYLTGIRASVMNEASHALVVAGHEIGDHGFAHLLATEASARAMRADERRSAIELRRLGAPVATWRPPHGRVTLSAWWRHRRAGQRLALWTHDAGDCRVRPPDPEALAARVVADGGGVVLLHGHDRGAEPKHAHVLAVTRAVVAAARREGLPVRTVGAVLGLVDERPAPRRGAGAPAGGRAEAGTGPDAVARAGAGARSHGATPATTSTGPAGR